jgi:septal ring-binding cell division protein DamX
MTIAPSPEHADTEPAEGVCAQCGAPLADDQEWCLECGGARTLIHRPPDWRIPAVIIGLVVIVALAAFAVVLVKLSSDANQRAALALATTPATPPVPAPASTTTIHATTTPTTPTTATTPSTPTTSTTSTTPTTPTTPTTSTTPTTPTTPTTAAAPPLTTPNGTRLEVWPPGLSGWTVALATTSTEAEAQTTAQQIASNGIQVGILDSSQHPRLKPGVWIVFTGRYPTQAQAEQVVTALQAVGQQQAVAKLVGRPGE